MAHKTHHAHAARSNMPTSQPITYACVATGSLQGEADSSINRLHRMLRRFSPRPFRLLCITDQPRNIDPSIIQIDASLWPEFKITDTHPTFYKISLFNPKYIPYSDIFYMDLSVIIQAPLSPLIEFANHATEDLVIVRGWAQSEVNSCVMRIRNTTLGFIHKDFAAGLKYPEHVPGDQDFVAGAMNTHCKAFRFFPNTHIVSFKKVMRQGVHDWRNAHQIAAGAMIVKFHGKPKPNTIFKVGYMFFKYGIRYIIKGKLAYPFEFRHLRKCWLSSDDQRSDVRQQKNEFNKR